MNKTAKNRAADWRKAHSKAAMLLTTVLTVVGLTVASTGGAVALQSDTAGLTVTATEATPDETVTLTFEFANTGDEPTATIVSVTGLPDDWTVQSHADDGGVWREDRSWLFRSVDAGGSVAPSITVAVPDNATGSVTVAGNATVGDGTVTSQTTVTVAESGGTATENATSETGTSDGSGPGFGVVGALVAAVALGRRLGQTT